MCTLKECANVLKFKCAQIPVCANSSVRKFQCAQIRCAQIRCAQIQCVQIRCAQIQCAQSGATHFLIYFLYSIYLE